MPEILYSENTSKRHYNQVIWSKSEDAKLCEMFPVSKPKDLEKTFNLTYEQIRTRARTLKLKSKKTLRRENLNQDFFSEVTIESSYWAGFLMADGNIQDSKIWIGLSNKDKDHLKKFARVLRLNDAVKEYSSVAGGLLKGKNYTRVVLDVHSTLLVESIKNNFNVLPRKTLKPYIPPEKIKDDYALAFLAGLIDGDGFINLYEAERYIRFGFIGSKEICHWASSILNEQLTKISRKPTAIVKKNSGRSYHEMRCSGKNAQILLNEIQKICNGLLLDRKWNKLAVFNKSKIWQKDKTKIS